MKFVTVATPDGASWGVLSEHHISLFGSTALAHNRTLAEVLRDGDLHTVLNQQTAITQVPLDSQELLPPIVDAKKIICVGLNYADHILEMNRPLPEKPVIFTRFNDSLVGSQQALIAPKHSEKFDFEGEFTIVIGKAGRNISREQALEHVFGYTIMNDGSIRDYQRHTHQFTPGKNFPKSGSLGPFVMTRDEFGEVSNQRITTTLNREIVQSSTLDQLIFTVADLIAYCSEWTELSPGDLIATGTPGGVGDGRTPPLWLKHGDHIAVEVEGLGVLTNSVSSE